MAWKSHFTRFSFINMSSPSLPMVPQWLKSFTSMSWFSLLQIDVEVEEPATLENPTQSFEIHIIVWRRTHLLAVIIYIIWYKYLCIIWYYLDIDIQDSRRSTQSVLEFLQNMAKSCVRLHPLRYIHCKPKCMVPGPQAAQGPTPCLQLDPPLKNATFVERSLWDWLVVAVILHQGCISRTSSNTVLRTH